MRALAPLASKCRSRIGFPDPARPCFFSTTTHDTCEIRTFYGTCKYDANRFVPLLEYCRRYPILNRVPNNRLIGTNYPQKPFLTSEAGRFLSRSALMLPFICHLHGKSVVGSFSEDNVGVLRGTGALCFKKICLGDLDDNTRAAGYQEAGEFLKKLVKKVHGDWALDHLPCDYENLLAKLEAENVGDEEDLLYDGCLCPDLVREYVQFETWRLAKMEFPAIGKQEKADRIVREIESQCQTYEAVCKSNVLLSSWGGSKPNTNTTPLAVPSQSTTPGSQSTTPTVQNKTAKKRKAKKKTAKKLPNTNTTPLAVPSQSTTPGSQSTTPTVQNKTAKKGKAKKKTAKKLKAKQKMFKKSGPFKIRLVDLVRHAIVHCVEHHHMNLIPNFSPEAIKSLKKNPYSISDVIKLVHYSFPRYVPAAIIAFKRNRAAKKFGIKRVWRIPSLYYS